LSGTVDVKESQDDLEFMEQLNRFKRRETTAMPVRRMTYGDFFAERMKMPRPSRRFTTGVIKDEIDTEAIL